MKLFGLFLLHVFLRNGACFRTKLFTRHVGGERIVLTQKNILREACMDGFDRHFSSHYLNKGLTSQNCVRCLVSKDCYPWEKSMLNAQQFLDSITILHELFSPINVCLEPTSSPDNGLALMVSPVFSMLI